MEILLVSHKGIASGMKSAMKMIIGEESQELKILELTEEDGIDIFSKNLEECITNWLSDENKKGIIFADLNGGAPYNQIEGILQKHNLKSRVKVISGMNLAIIIDALFKDIDVNNLDEIHEIMKAGKEAILCMDLDSNTSDNK
ncbi:hypothetical protein R4I97_03935 [Brachyspira pilosicoli]|uniref:PTS sugar transporter subunit IIA n=1 Tax=Brachyspira pilosicoli TaxID=52584 RepID=UPI0030043993